MQSEISFEKFLHGWIYKILFFTEILLHKIYTLFPIWLYFLFMFHFAIVQVLKILSADKNIRLSFNACKYYQTWRIFN